MLNVLELSKDQFRSLLVTVDAFPSLKEGRKTASRLIEASKVEVEKEGILIPSMFFFSFFGVETEHN